MNTTEADIRSNNRIHTVYKDDSGKRLPSVTTVLSVLAKPALIKWAHGLGLKGIDMDGYRDELAEIGKLAHRMILDHLRGNKTDTAHSTPEQVDLAENCFLKYLEWERQHKVEPTLVETPMVSTALGFGGTPDFIGMVDGALTLMDYKTGKGIYPEYFYQLGGYSLLYVPIIRDFRILNIGRSDDEQFVEESRSDLNDEREIFLHTLAIYKLKAKKNR